MMVIVNFVPGGRLAGQVALADSLEFDLEKKIAAMEGDNPKKLREQHDAIFILVFVLAGLLFGSPDRENIIYFILLVAAMMTGFLDDCAKVSWGELRKGLLDLVIAIMTAITVVNFNGSGSADDHPAKIGPVNGLPQLYFPPFLNRSSWSRRTH